VEEGDEGSLLNWASWAVGWVPQLVFGGEESEEPSDPCEFTHPVLHIGLYVNTATVTMKGSESCSDRASNSNSSSSRSKYSPYLRCGFQGLVTDFVVRGRDTQTGFGVSKVLL
jgi:hypothetical protein